MFSKIFAFFKKFNVTKDVLQFEIPIDRPDKCIHSEILIVNKKEIKEI